VATALGSLGWLVVVRNRNEEIYADLVAAGNSSLTTTGIAGLPGSTTTFGGGAAVGGPIQGLGGDGAAAGGPIQGLGGDGAAAGGETAGPQAEADERRGDFGPIGAASGVAFLLAFMAAALTGAAPEYRAWRRRGRRLSKREQAAAEAAQTAEAELDAAAVGAPGQNRGYDGMAAETRRIVAVELQQVQIWHGQIREGYSAECGRRNLTPRTLRFAAIPDADTEAQSMFGLDFPPGVQTGGYAFGATPAADGDEAPNGAPDPDAPEPTPTTGSGPASPGGTPPPAQGPKPEPGQSEPPPSEPDPTPPPPRRPSVERAVEQIGERIQRLRRRPGRKTNHTDPERG
jgi:hypothetical protein